MIQKVMVNASARWKRAAITLMAMLALLITFTAASAALSVQELEKTYGIDIQDNVGVLSGEGSEEHLDEIDSALASYGPNMTKYLVKFYKKSQIPCLIRVMPAPDDFAEGDIVLDGDGLTINLYYSEKYDIDGVTTETIAHELGHFVHYVLEDTVDENTLKNEWIALNGKSEYVGDSYPDKWSAIHEGIFAYDYGMSEYYEDISTMFEYLVDEQEYMTKQFASAQNIALKKKAELLRTWIDKYIGVKTVSVFASLEAAEANPPTDEKPQSTAPTKGYMCSSWAQKELQLGLEQGIFTIKDGSDLTQNVTRREFCSILSDMMCTYFTQDIQGFFDYYDEKISDYNFADIRKDDDAIRLIAMLGIVSGNDGKFRPNDYITREEAAVILHMLSEYMELDSAFEDCDFDDKDDIDDWAKEHVNFVAFSGIMMGNKGAFNPHGGYSIEQTLITLSRIFIDNEGTYDYKVARPTYGTCPNYDGTCPNYGGAYQGGGHHGGRNGGYGRACPNGYENCQNGCCIR